MSYYVVTPKQITVTLTTFVVAAAVSLWLVFSVFNYMDLPEVYVDGNGACVKVVNYQNGDGYSCQDRDVILRKYHVVHVD